MSEIEFTQAIESQKLLLKGYAIKLTRDKDSAQDLVQETLFRAYKYKNRFEKGTNFKAWIMKIMKNIFLNQYHKEKKKPESVSLSDNEFIVTHFYGVTDNKGPENVYLKEIYSEIEKLDDKYGQSLMLHYKGFKYNEIAERDNVPLGTVKNRIFVARESLKKVLKA